MNKKGFTLVEILISISLVSIVLISMLNTLVKLKDVYAKSNDDTEIRVYGAAVSRILNNDVINGRGINNIDGCNTSESTNAEGEKSSTSECNFSLNNGSRRRIKLYVVENITPFIGEAGKTLNSRKVDTRSTIEYINIDNSEVILLKTVSSNQTYTINNENDIIDVTSKNFYHYTTLSTTTKSYSRDGSSVTDRVKVITLKASDSQFDVNIFSAGTYPS